MHKKKKYKKERHHIIPKSRGGTSRLENTMIVQKNEHMHYHALFDNKVPSEILEYLNNKFWARNYYITYGTKKEERYF